MSLFREIDFRKGSALDKYNAIPTIYGSVFKRTNKGIAIQTGGSKYVSYDSQLLPNNAFSIVIWARIKIEAVLPADRAMIIGSNSTGNLRIIGLHEATTGYPTLNLGSGNSRLFKWSADRNFHCFIFTIPGSAQTDITNSKLYVDGVDITAVSTVSTNVQAPRSGFVYAGGGNTTTSGCDILKIKVYDTVISEIDRNKEYSEFLQSQITEKPVRGFELVKPTDLSYQKDRGLLAAYNFKRNGDTLVDISGNGYNFTIDPGTVERDNGLYFPMTRATTTSLITLPAGSKTVCCRGTMHNIPGSFARIYSSYIMFNAAFTLFYYRAASDTIISFATGLTTADFNKEFDFVYVQEGNSIQKLYINGVLVGTTTETITSNQLIGEINSTANGGYVTHKDLRFYTRAFSEQEIKDYHNSFIKPVILEDWSGSAVSDVI